MNLEDALNDRAPEYIYGDYPTWNDAACVIQSIVAIFPSLEIKVRCVDGMYQIAVPVVPHTNEMFDGLQYVMLMRYSRYGCIVYN